MIIENADHNIHFEVTSKEDFEKWIAERDKQIIKEFVNEADKYICNHHAKCEDCDFTYKTCFTCFYHTEWLKEHK